MDEFPSFDFKTAFWNRKISIFKLIFLLHKILYKYRVVVVHISLWNMDFKV